MKHWKNNSFGQQSMAMSSNNLTKVNCSIIHLLTPSFLRTLLC